MAPRESAGAWIHAKGGTDVVYTSVFPRRFSCGKSDLSLSKDGIGTPVAALERQTRTH